MPDKSLGDILQAVRDDADKAKNLLSKVEAFQRKIAQDTAYLAAIEHDLILELAKKHRFSCLKVDYPTLRQQERGK